MKVSTLMNFCLLSIFLGGSNVLTALYVDYSIGGPASLAIILCFLLLQKGRFCENKAEFNIFICLLVVLLFNFLTERQLAFFQTFTALLLPVCISIIIKYNRYKFDRKSMRRIIWSFYWIECSLAIIERIFYFRLFPNLGYEILESNEFRSYSLFGHPLSNSAIVYLLMNFYLISNHINDKIKILIWLLGFVAILCFNSRTALILSILSLLIYIFQQIFSNKTRMSLKIFYVLSIIFCSYIVVYLFSVGLGDRLTTWGLIDGSAMVRVNAFDLFISGYDNWYDYLLGMPYKTFELIRNQAGLTDITIENCWIIFLLRYGAIFMIILVVLYYKLFKNILQLFSYNTFQKYFIIVPWILNLSTSNSLATGDNSISILFILLFIFSKNDTQNYTLVLAK